MRWAETFVHAHHVWNPYGWLVGYARTDVRRRTKSECHILCIVGVSKCRVSYVDIEGVEHAAVVNAETLYEAVALAVADIRQDDLTGSIPTAMTEFTVTVYRKPTEHKIRLNQVNKWAKHTVKEGPVGIIKRQRVRKLLGEKE